MGGNVAFDKWLNDDGSENFKCRAWVNFNGVGTVAIRASGNVSSITDNGVGDYTINFTDAMPDVNYAALAMGDRLSTDSYFNVCQQNNSRAKTTTQFHVMTKASTATLEDQSNMNMSFHR